MAAEFNLPTYLTLLRIALIPLLVLVFYSPWQHAHFAAAMVFLLAGITDWLDGYLARKMAQETDFGAFLDPVADKMMVVFVLVLLIQTEHSTYLTVPAALIISRELTIASLREWMAQIGQTAKVKVSQLGKWKTTLQMIAIALLLVGENIAGLPVKILGYILLYIATILTLWSMIQYLIAAMTVLQK
jgi:CDP-diacylglycerol--glycerol-3-phosphate 3-phosphatidyltransferase